MNQAEKVQRKPEHILIAIALIVVAGMVLWSVWSTPELSGLSAAGYVQAEPGTVQPVVPDDVSGSLPPSSPGDSALAPDTDAGERSAPSSEQSTKKTSSAPPTVPGKININLAGKDELIRITGIGEVKAQAIIDYRTQIGRFQKIEDIMNVNGIGEKTFEKMRDEITV
jgi:comEA protein